MRLLILVLLVVLIVWWLRRAFGVANDAKGGDRSAKPAVQGELVSCSHCGLLLPRAEAREASGALYCSEQHARLGPKA